MADVLSDFYNLMPSDVDEPEEKNVPPMAEVAFDLAVSLACPVCLELRSTWSCPRGP
jgi:hypothetical protein